MCFLTCKGLEMMQYLNGFYRPVSKSMEIWESGNLNYKEGCSPLYSVVICPVSEF